MNKQQANARAFKYCFSSPPLPTPHNFHKQFGLKTKTLQKSPTISSWLIKAKLVYCESVLKSPENNSVQDWFIRKSIKVPPMAHFLDEYSFKW